MAGGWKRTVLKNRATLAASEINITDLGKRGFLSSIDVQVEATNGSTNNQDQHIRDIIRRVEVLANGSKVIQSLVPEEIQFSAALDHGKPAPDNLTEDPDDVQTGRLRMNLGRYPRDPLYALDLSKFTSVELRVDFNEALVRAASATTAFVTGTGVISVAVERFNPPKAIAPLGFIKKREVSTFTTAASGEREIELPVGNKYRRIGIRSFEAGTALPSAISDARLEVNGGDEIVHDEGILETIQNNEYDYSLKAEEHYRLHKTSNDTETVQIGRVRVGVLNGGATGGRSAYLDPILHNQFTLELWDVATPTEITADNALDLYVYGWGYMHMAAIPYDLAADGSDGLDTAGMSDASLFLTEGNAGGAGAVVLEEYERNP